jgi:hypothetical protein
MDDVQPVAKILPTVQKNAENASEPPNLTIEPPTEVPAKPSHQPQQFFLGDNRKYICIMVKDAGAVYLNETSLNFLSTILGACKLNLGDVAIINYHNAPQQFNGLKEKLGAQYLILFDVSPTEINLPFSIPFYQVQSYNNSQILVAPALEAMQGSDQQAKLEKSKLWLSLKKMFGI